MELHAGEAGVRQRQPAGHEGKATERRRGAKYLAQRVAGSERAQPINRAAEQHDARRKRARRKQIRTSQRVHSRRDQNRDRVRQLVLGRRRPRGRLWRESQVRTVRRQLVFERMGTKGTTMNTLLHLPKAYRRGSRKACKRRQPRHRSGGPCHRGGRRAPHGASRASLRAAAPRSVFYVPDPPPRLARHRWLHGSQSAMSMTQRPQNTALSTQRTDTSGESAPRGFLSSLGSVLARTLPWGSTTRTATPSASRETAVHESRPATGSETTKTSSAGAWGPSASSARDAAPLTWASQSRSLYGGSAPRASTLGLSRSKWGSLDLGAAPSSALVPQPRDAGVEPAQTLASVLGKRNDPISELGDRSEADVAVPPLSRKRRMVWDPEMGFVDAEDLARRRPPPPPPQNEAERILRALESMRTPLGDARREKIVRARATPAWHSHSVPVPLPQPDRAGVWTESLRSPAFRGISPHARALQRSRLLRQSRANAAPSLRAKLQQSMSHDALQRPVDHDTEDEVDEESERRTKRRAAKAKLSPKQSKTKVPKTDSTPPPAPEPRKKDAAPRLPKNDQFQVREDHEPSTQRSILRQGATKSSRRHAPSGRITAFVDDDDEDDMPSGQELAKIKLPTSLFPKDYQFGEATSSTRSQEAPAARGSDAPDKSASQATSKPAASASLLQRLEPAVTTTPMKEPAPGAVRFAANDAATTTQATTSPTAPEKPAPPSNFFASAPTAPSSSLDTTKKSGPMPDFFGVANRPAPASTASTGLGLASAFGTQKKPEEPAEPSSSLGGASSTAPAPDSQKKREHTDEESPAKKSTSLNPAAPSFSFTAPKTDPPTSGKAPAFSFGTKDAAAEDKPSAAPSSDSSKPFAASQDTPSTASSSSTKPAPSFSFGTTAPAPSFGAPSAPSSQGASDAAASAKPAAPFSFGAPTPKGLGGATESPADTPAPAADTPAPAAQDASQPAFSFGAVNKPADPAASSEPKADKKEPPSFSFGAPASKPAFSFGGTASSAAPSATAEPEPAKDNKAATPAFSFGTATSVAPTTKTSEAEPPSQKPAFTFGTAAPSSSDKPAFSFGSSATSDKSTPSFGSGPDTTNKPAVSFGSAAAKTEKPTFSFGEPAKTEKPSFSFGQPAQPKLTPDTKPATAPADKPGFSFGNAAGAATNAAPSFSFGTSSPAVSTPPATTSAPTFSFGAPKESAPVAAPKSTPSFSFGQTSQPESKPAPTFSFGSTDATAQKPASDSPAPTFSFGATSQAPPASAVPPATTTFSFGAPASPAPASGGALPSMPAAPAPTTSFSFGAPQPPAPAPTTSFTFGSNPPSGVFQFGAGAPGSAPTSGTSTPGGSSSPAPTTSFTFGGAGAAAPSFSFGAPAPSQAATPGMFGAPSQPDMGQTSGNGLFSMGASPAPPGGRQIKPLRQPRRRN